MRVVAADDDEQVRDVMSRLLGRLGAEVELARGGEEAFALLRGAMNDSGRRFDLAFVDLAMPWSLAEAGRAAGGLELASALRAEEARAGARPIRLVALTGADDGRASDARLSGFDRFLQKPVGIDALKRELDLAASPPRDRRLDDEGR
jgi:CheY-like chemotaxis protein